MADLCVRLGSLTLPNPVMVAAGTFGYGVEFAQAAPLERLGALITKTLTRHPRSGNPPPRLTETPSGMLNAVGLQNIGLDAFLREKLPILRSYRVPLVVSMLGESPDEVSAMAQALDRAQGVAAIELNLSCPNIKKPSEPRVSDAERRQPETRNPKYETQKMVAQDPEATAAFVRAARESSGKPLIAKLSPETADLVPIAQAAERSGAAALSIGNTFIGMSLDPESRRSRLSTMTGGLSGPAIRPLAVYRVWYTSRSVTVPIIGVGGVVHAEDAIEFLLAGAHAVAIGTANFANPRAPLRVLRGLERYLQRHRMRSLEDLRGALDNPATAQA